MKAEVGDAVRGTRLCGVPSERWFVFPAESQGWYPGLVCDAHSKHRIGTWCTICFNGAPPTCWAAMPGWGQDKGSETLSFSMPQRGRILPMRRVALAGRETTADVGLPRVASTQWDALPRWGHGPGNAVVDPVKGGRECIRRRGRSRGRGRWSTTPTPWLIFCVRRRILHRGIPRN